MIFTTLRTIRDDAWLISGLSGAQPRERLDAWAAEPSPASSGRSWNGERLIMGSSAGHWLQLPGVADPVLDGAWRLVVTPAVWQPHIVRARTARDLVSVDQLLFHWQEPGQPLPADWRAPTSLLAAMTVPSLVAGPASEQRTEARHALVRLAWRLHRLGLDGRLPADPQAAAAAVGPLAIRVGEALLPLAYTRRGAGFLLALDTAGEKPPGIDLGTWQRWTQPEPIPAHGHLHLPGRRLEILIDPCEPETGGSEDPADF